jgi:hypothetical protein
MSRCCGIENHGTYTILRHVFLDIFLHSRRIGIPAAVLLLILNSVIGSVQYVSVSSSLHLSSDKTKTYGAYN